jgi:hypothetical protein
MPGNVFFRNPSWARFNEWEKVLTPFYDRASFMLGRKKYKKLNIEDLALEEVSK